MRKNILLVSPDFDIESFWISEEEGAATEVVNDLVPLGLATIAGMTPDNYQVDIWDEVVHGRIDADTRFPRDYDLVGLTGYNVHFLRCVEIAKYFRDRGMLVAVGGPGVSGLPDRYREVCDVLFIGEAELTWPQFLKDWEQDDFQPEYRQIEKIDLTESALPRWDSIAKDMGKYALGAVQTTRGCPFDCEFCDVIYLFGRKARHKPVETVIQEVLTLERLGITTILFCDDEFIGDPRYAKQLLRALIPVNNALARPITFMTQLTMNLSRDEELLELCADANFGLVFVGIETPNQASLKETRKFQNLRKDLVSDVKHILSYGIAIRSGLIVGFDHDDADIFRIQDEFAHDACLPSVTLSMLKAIPGTRLWRRLREEGRVLDINRIKGTPGDSKAFKPRSYTNIAPASMTRVELMRGYRKLAEKLYSWDSFSRRMRGFLSLIERRPDVPETPLAEAELASWRRVGAAGPEARKAVDEIVEHTLRVAPFMAHKIRILTLQHARHKTTFDNLLPYIDRLADLEESGEMVFEPEQRRVPVPESFRQLLLVDRDRYFAELHHNAYDQLAEKDRVAEALTEVFVDFLAHEGEQNRLPNGFQPHHRAFLTDLVDRTCVKLNEDSAAAGVVADSDAGPAPDVRRARLAEDVLRSVEQGLMRMGQAGAA